MTVDISLFALISSASESGGALTILGKGEEAETRPFAQIVREAESAAAVLEERGFVPGDRLAAVARTTFDFVVASLATWRLGGAVVPLPFPPRFVSNEVRREQIQQRIAVAAPSFVLAQEGDPEAVGAFQSVMPSEFGGTDRSPVLPLPPARTPAVVQFTSGSTSDPRCGIVLSHSAVAAQAFGLQDHLRPGRSIIGSFLLVAPAVSRSRIHRTSVEVVHYRDPRHVPSVGHLPDRPWRGG